MAASYVMDMPLTAPHDSADAEPLVVEKKIRISQLAPKYDDLLGSLPPDREVSVYDLVRPAIIRLSDKHTGLPNAYVAQIYEMQKYVIPQAEIDNGDSIDLQALGLGRREIYLNIEHICLLDQENHLQARYGTHKLKTRGNHDLTTALTPEESREVGLNIFPGVLTKHPKRRDEVDIHGHQPESPFMVAVPTRIASGIYDDVASRGEDGATASKHVTKITTGGIGLDGSLRHLSFHYDANINNGHRHTLERLELPYKKKLRLPTISRELDNAAKTAFFASVLWLHRTGALEGIIRNAVIPALKNAAASDSEVAAAFDGKKPSENFFGIRLSKSFQQ